MTAFLPEDEWPCGPEGTVLGDWREAITGYRLIVMVGPLGALAGYVELPEGHPLQASEDSSVIDELNVHGGVTYFGRELGDGALWIGFDCAHSGDLIPCLGKLFGNEIFRGPEYVASELTKLAHQIGNLC